jgi:hypothetical protein
VRYVFWYVRHAVSEEPADSTCNFGFKGLAGLCVGRYSSFYSYIAVTTFRGKCNLLIAIPSMQLEVQHIVTETRQAAATVTIRTIF